MKNNTKEGLPQTGAELHAKLGRTTALTEDECTWMLRARPGDVGGYLTGVVTAAILLEGVKQDKEVRYPPGYAGLHSLQE